MRKFFKKFGIVAAVIALSGGAYAWSVSSITWGGSATVLADAGANGADAITMPKSTQLGWVCSIANATGAMNGNAPYTPGFTQQVSNDKVTWATVDAGQAPLTIAVTDAGPLPYSGVLLPLPFEYTRLATTASALYIGNLSCTFARQ